jgi:uncharacterized membrane protein (DUF485 family)
MNSVDSPRRRNDSQRLGWLLCLVLLALVSIFVLLSELAPGLMSRPLAEGNALTLGFVLGIVDVIIVIGVALYFEHRLNRLEIPRDKAG